MTIDFCWNYLDWIHHFRSNHVTPWCCSFVDFNYVCRFKKKTTTKNGHFTSGSMSWDRMRHSRAAAFRQSKIQVWEYKLSRHRQKMTDNTLARHPQRLRGGGFILPSISRASTKWYSSVRLSDSMVSQRWLLTRFVFPLQSVGGTVRLQYVDMNCCLRAVRQRRKNWMQKCIIGRRKQRLSVLVLAVPVLLLHRNDAPSIELTDSVSSWKSGTVCTGYLRYAFPTLDNGKSKTLQRCPKVNWTVLRGSHDGAWLALLIS